MTQRPWELTWGPIRCSLLGAVRIAVFIHIMPRSRRASGIEVVAKGRLLTGMVRFVEREREQRSRTWLWVRPKVTCRPRRPIWQGACFSMLGGPVYDSN